MRKFACETCPEVMTVPVFTIVTETGDEYHFCSLKCMKMYIEDEIKKVENNKQNIDKNTNKG